VLAYETNGLHTKPVAYMAWAQLSAEAESRYVNNAAVGLTLEDWQSGERFWITDFCAPYGHASDFAQALATTLSEFCFRSLYHRGPERGMRVHYFRGKHVTLEQAKQWWSERPILAHKRTELKDGVV
jgi:cytolysin-activating lysine-acyltransferase